MIQITETRLNDLINKAYRDGWLDRSLHREAGKKELQHDWETSTSRQILEATLTKGAA
jgi:hypothetical protein